MKRSLYKIAAVGWLLYGTWVSFLVAGADFKQAQFLFEEGKFQECEQTINQLLAGTNLPPEEKNKLLAMQEYLIGSSPERIVKAVEQAQQLAAQKNLLTMDLFQQATLLIRRAAAWKERGIAEYQDLSNAATTLLEQIHDDGNPEIALKILILQIRNFNLNGEYQEPIVRINQMLKLYYPVVRQPRGKLPAGAVELLLLAGEQHIGIGMRSNSEREKINAFSQAAKHYLRIADSLPPDNPKFQELSNRLHYCREALRLLGYQLKLPSKIKPQTTITLTMIDEMLAAQRYHDVVLALENNPERVGRLRYAFALSAIGRFEPALAVLKEPELPTDEAIFILRLSRNCLAAGKKMEALGALEFFLQHNPDHPDSLNAIADCAGLLLADGQYRRAATYFLLLAEKTKPEELKRAAQFNAAQSFYQGEQWEECIQLLREMPVTPQRTLLRAQARMRKKDYSAALDDIKAILDRKNFNRDEYKDLLKMAIRAAMEASPADAIIYCNSFLNENPTEAESFDYAKHLAALYQKNKAPEVRYSELGQWAIRYHLEHHETIPLVLLCAAKIQEKQAKEALLAQLFKRKAFNEEEQLSMLQYLPSAPLQLDFLKRYRKPFVNRQEPCELLFRQALLEAELADWPEALKICETLLAQEKIYRYKEVKLLYGKVLTSLKREEDARKNYQELLLTPLTPEEKRPLILLLANLWEQSGDAAKAIATGWTAIPFDGKGASAEEQKVIDALLQLIIRNATKINSTIDLEDARALEK